jgi:hypothetical protein
MPQQQRRSTTTRSFTHRRLNWSRLSLFLVIGIGSISFWLAPPLYPFKIFVVFVHEAGHALAALLTGGRVLAMVVTPWESGYVRYVGGNPVVVAAAGYVGSALFGSLLLLCTGKKQWTTTIFGCLALFFALVTLGYVRNTFGILFGMGTAAVFGALAWKPVPGAPYFIDVLAVMSALYALYDLGDFLLAGARTDAVILAEITRIPAVFWALLWSGVSILALYMAGKQALTRP